MYVDFLVEPRHDVVFNYGLVNVLQDSTRRQDHEQNMQSSSTLNHLHSLSTLSKQIKD